MTVENLSYLANITNEINAILEKYDMKTMIDISYGLITEVIIQNRPELLDEYLREGWVTRPESLDEYLGGSKTFVKETLGEWNHEFEEDEKDTRVTRSFTDIALNDAYRPKRFTHSTEYVDNEEYLKRSKASLKTLAENWHTKSCYNPIHCIVAIYEHLDDEHHLEYATTEILSAHRTLGEARTEWLKLTEKGSPNEVIVNYSEGDGVRTRYVINTVNAPDVGNV